MINIGGNSDDEFYRYKRHKTEVKHVRNCTAFLNFDVIARELNIKPEELMKYLQKTLGLSININIIKGVISVEIIEKQIEKYIKLNIICPTCGIPEWDGETCNACGGTKKLEMRSNEKENELVEEYKVHEEDIKISLVMHYLYDLLVMYPDTNTQENILISRCLEYCWADEDSRNSDKKIKIINKKLQKHNIPEYVPKV
jgi:translation initiation factor 2 beta subunit (eIF-2beta)/eIF-5